MIRRRIWSSQILLMVIMVESFFLGFAREVEKADAAIPVATLSPPEGNTTFLGGTTWCVARPGAPQADLQNALDWACGTGKTDCRVIQPGGPCFEPNTLFSHASYAFNFYYQQNGNSDIACNFGGTAILTKSNPSYGNCKFAVSSSGSEVSLASPTLKKKPSLIWWEVTTSFLLLLYLKC